MLAGGPIRRHVRHARLSYHGPRLLLALPQEAATSLNQVLAHRGLLLPRRPPALDRQLVTFVRCALSIRSICSLMYCTYEVLSISIVLLGYRSVCDLYLCAGFVIGLLLAFALYPWATLPDAYLQRLGKLAKERMRLRHADETDSAYSDDSLIRFGHLLFRWLLIICSLGITVGIGVILYFYVLFVLGPSIHSVMQSYD